jgi:hypothetical protein
MGHEEHTTGEVISARGRWRQGRECLRKGCGKIYRPRRPNQRYCRERECLRELRRWQAAKRQQKRRATSEGRKKHAQAERVRRQRQKSLASAPRPPSSSSARAETARGHAGKKSLPGRCAIGPGVMNLPVIRLALCRTTAARNVARPCVASGTVNASGGPARRKRDVSNVGWSTPRHGPNAASDAFLRRALIAIHPEPRGDIAPLRSAAMDRGRR